MHAGRAVLLVVQAPGANFRLRGRIGAQTRAAVLSRLSWVHTGNGVYRRGDARQGGRRVPAALPGGEHRPEWLGRIAPYRAGTARRTVRSIRLRAAGAATHSNCVGSHSGLQPVSIPRQRKLLSPDGCRRRAFSCWPLRADPAVARSGHADAWRFASIQESMLLVTRTGSILVRAPSPWGGACRLVMPSVANITGQAYARAWTNSRRIMAGISFLSSRRLS
jgi:hypothetical protein